MEAKLHFILDLEGKSSIGLDYRTAILNGVVRWAIFGAFAALLSIAVMILTSEQQYPLFCVAWFIAAVVSMALFGAICTICSIGSGRLGGLTQD